MPPLEAQVESRPSPADELLAQLVALPELREMLRRTLQLADVSCAFGLPRRLSSETAKTWLSGPHALFVLTDSTHFDQRAAWVALPSDQAAGLVDRCLGGPGGVQVAGLAAAPSEAECGVLAYLAARCVRICAPEMRLRDVTIEHPAALHAACADTLLWPMRVTVGGEIELDLKLFLSPSTACLHRTSTLQLAVFDTLTGDVLDGLTCGDLVVLEAWPCAFTAEGLCGVLELTATGHAENLRVALEGNRLRAVGGAVPASKRPRARIVLHEESLSFAEFADLCAGSARTIGVAGLTRGQLMHDARAIAAGDLVRYGAALALRVDTLYSMR